MEKENENKQVEKIFITEVLDCLEKGKTRPEIAEHFGISMADCRELFKHPKLKGKKAKKKRDFEVIDDTKPLSEKLPEDDKQAQAGNEKDSSDKKLDPVRIR